MSPQAARRPENLKKVYAALYGKKKSEKVYRPDKKTFKIGDKVRISVKKGIFGKEYDSNWSEEIFTVSKVLRKSKPIVYQVKDLANEVVQGTFYMQQLQKTQQQIYRVDKILRKRKATNGVDQVLVHWLGYSDKFDSWENAKNILKSGALNAS